MPAYIVSAPVSSGVTTKGGVNRCIVFAHDTADALLMAQSLNPLGGNANWAAGTATAIAAPSDMVGWRLKVTVSDTAGAEVANVTSTGIATNALDDVADLIVIALNATASIAAASYNNVSQVLTIAETTDSLGDHAVTVEMFPPASNNGEDVSIAGFVGAIVDEGASGAALSVTLAADAHIVPSVPVGLVSK